MIKITAIVVKNGIEKSLYQAKCDKLLKESEFENYRMRVKFIAQKRYNRHCKILFLYTQMGEKA